MFLNIGTIWEPPFVNLICIPPQVGCRKLGIAGFIQDELGFTVNRLQTLWRRENPEFRLRGFSAGGAPGLDGNWDGAIRGLMDGIIDFISPTIAVNEIR